MLNKSDFYIGWQDEMPDMYQSFIKKRLVLLFVLIPAFALCAVFFQKPFVSHIFELGNVQEFTGVYYERPVPILEVTSDNFPDNISRNALLVGYGKKGARSIMEWIRKKNGKLHQRKITLKGTLIYGDGKAVIELTERENSLVTLYDDWELSTREEEIATKTKKLQGEILDPKCYFGVMKPGEGKTHKSCAIRCISGGIPPVLRHETGDDGNPYRYYIMLDERGNPINKKILPYVGEQIVINGTVSDFQGWDVLYVHTDNLLLNVMPLGNVVWEKRRECCMCRKMKTGNDEHRWRFENLQYK